MPNDERKYAPAPMIRAAATVSLDDAAERVDGDERLAA